MQALSRNTMFSQAAFPARVTPPLMNRYTPAQLHAVMPVTRGVRLSCVFWVQSIVPNPLQRTLLFEMAQHSPC